MVLNLERCYDATFGSNTTKNEFVLEKTILVLGITIDSLFTYYFQLKQLCKKVAKN